MNAARAVPGISRLSEWLLLHQPLVWRQRPLLGVGLALGWLLVIAFWSSMASRPDFSLFETAGFIPSSAWLFWHFRRDQYPVPSITWRQRVLGPLWVDVGIWLAFLLPGWLFYSHWSFRADPRGGFSLWAHMTPLIALTTYRWGIGWLNLALRKAMVRHSDLLSRLCRWDLPLPNFLRKIAIAHETTLATRYPRLWALKLHRYLCVCFYGWVLLGVAYFAPSASDSDIRIDIAAALMLYLTLGLMGYRLVGRRALVTRLQQHSPSWLWVLCDAVFTIGVVSLVLLGAVRLILPDAQGGLTAQLLGFYGIGGIYSALRVWWITIWAWVLLQIFFVWDHSKLSGLKMTLTFIVALYLGGFALFLLPISQWLSLAILWCAGAAYLARPRTYSVHLVKETWLARILMIVAFGYMLLHYALSNRPLVAPSSVEPAESIAVQFWSDLAINLTLVLILRASALKVIRARAAVPRLE